MSNSERHAMERKALDAEGGSGPSSSDASDDDPVLEAKHKIFLSHSGAQKEFVDHLCMALEERCYKPFFDRRRESLPKGKRFAELIFEAAQQCQVFVVVVSEEYFTSKWPMIELDAFVKATKKMKSSVKQSILPLFYGLSMSELKDEKRKQRWFEVWETFARADVRGLTKVDDWKCALDELTKFNGLPYDRELKQVVEYEKEIVSHICNLVTPNIKWEDSHVQGNAHEVVIRKMKQVKASQLSKGNVVGLYGVGGIGKTTVCKRLCNELSNEFEGRVCHIEFDSASSNSKLELLSKVLIKLTKISPKVIEQLNEGQCENVLKKNLEEQKTFLAIDNVLGDYNSIKQTKVFLQAPSHPDSLILMTTRAQKTLEGLGVDGGACLEMPELERKDARNLFLHHAGIGQQFTSEEDIRYIDLCVNRCCFFKGNGRDSHYHPLALEVFGRQLGHHGKNPLEWEKALSLYWNFNGFLGENEVFKVLRTSFDLLSPNEQALFMDLGIFSLPFYEYGMLHWNSKKLSDYLSIVHNQGGQYLPSLLDSLKGKGLLQDVDLSMGRINMHDLYRELVVLEAKGKLVEANSIGSRRWVYIDVQDGDLSMLEETPIGGCWQNLTRLFIHGDDSLIQLSRQGDDSSIQPLEWESIPHSWESWPSIEWQYFSNVLVLHLVGLKNMRGTLNLKGMKCLRSLHIIDLFHMKRLEGVEGLRNLFFLEWRCYSFSVRSEHKATMGQFPSSLKYLDICAQVVVSSVNAFARCTNLCKVTLEHVVVGEELNLRNCLSLTHVKLMVSKGLVTLSLSPTTMVSNLQSLDLHSIVLKGIDQCVCLLHLVLNLEDFMEVPNLLSLTNLQTLSMHEGRDFVGCHIPRQLRGLLYTNLKGSIQAPNLSGFNQLQVLSVIFSWHMTSLSVTGDLPALRILSLDCCFGLQRLPNLSGWTSLEELHINSCESLELHEEDMQMFARLPSLRPMQLFSSKWLGSMLDLRRWKLLRPVPSLDWENRWEEEELGPPPIKLRKYFRTELDPGPIKVPWQIKSKGL